jgi:hypothetical protein
MPPVPAKVVTIITVFEARERVLEAFVTLGVRGYSTFQVEGAGVHGDKRIGLVESENLVYVVLASDGLATRMLTWVETQLLPRYPGIAYSSDVAAVAARPIE